MDTKNDEVSGKPIAGKLMAKMNRAARDSRAMAEGLQKTVVTNRTLPRTGCVDGYERHMKYGPAREYWNDFVFEGYVNHRTDSIYLAGLPDVPGSRPHSEGNGFWR